MHKTQTKENKEGTFEKLEVTVIPVDDEPYSKVITYPTQLLSKYHSCTDSPRPAARSVLIGPHLSLYSICSICYLSTP